MKASLHNLGCKVNSYETQAMEQLLREAGYTIVPFDGDEAADVYVINTCSVTNIADRKSRQMLHRARKQNPNAIVVATGCYAQEAGSELEDDGTIDLVVGNNQKKNLVKLLEEYGRSGKRMAVDDLTVQTGYEALSIDTVSEHTRAYIKIQDGCNQFCSYCIIPYLRGRARSRGREDVLLEVGRLAASGYKEFVLTGIHLSSYGSDFGGEGNTDAAANAAMPGQELLGLIEDMGRIPGVCRIRLGSLEPRVITEDFVGRLAKVEAVCPHFHLSLQSGCDATLKRMNRKYDTAEYEESCRILRRHYSDVAITTDVIVGFPQESDEEFAVTRDYLERIHFYEMHVFKYSRRKGTVADRMDGQVPDGVKGARSAKLIALASKMSAEYREGLVGQTVLVLFEELVDEGGTTAVTGHTTTYVRVYVEAGADMAGDMINRILPVTILSLTDDKGAVRGIVKK